MQHVQEMLSQPACMGQNVNACTQCMGSDSDGEGDGDGGRSGKYATKTVNSLGFSREMEPI